MVWNSTQGLSVLFSGDEKASHGKFTLVEDPQTPYEEGPSRLRQGAGRQQVRASLGWGRLTYTFCAFLTCIPPTPPRTRPHERANGP